MLSKLVPSSYFSYRNEILKFIFALFPLNILIAIVEIYCLNLIINKTRKVFASIYWAFVIIAGIINIACLVIDIGCHYFLYVFYYNIIMLDFL